MDYGWWNWSKGVPDFKGLKIGQKVNDWGVKSVSLSSPAHTILLDRKGVLGSSHSGMTGLNLVAQFGANPILLVGYDCSIRDGQHWHGRHPGTLSNPHEGTVRRWRQRLDDQAASLKKFGFTVINCSEQSELQNYRKMSLQCALDDLTAS